MHLVLRVYIYSVIQRVCLVFSVLKELDIEPPEVECLLVACILDGTIQGKIDQVQQVLMLDTAPQGSAR